MNGHGPGTGSGHDHDSVHDNGRSTQHVDLHFHLNIDTETRNLIRWGLGEAFYLFQWSLAQWLKQRTLDPEDKKAFEAQLAKLDALGREPPTPPPAPAP